MIQSASAPRRTRFPYTTLFRSVAAVALRVADRAGLPSLLLYLALGIGLGEGGVGVQFENFALTQTLGVAALRSEEHTSELQSPCNLVCRHLLEKKNTANITTNG